MTGVQLSRAEIHSLILLGPSPLQSLHRTYFPAAPFANGLGVVAGADRQSRVATASGGCLWLALDPPQRLLALPVL